MPDRRDLPSVARSRQVLLDCIGPAPELTLVRGLGNRGDELIWAGTRQLLGGHLYREIGIDELPRASGDTAVLTGGGAWSRHYHQHMPTVLAVAEARFRRVIVLPSSFDVAEDVVRAALTRTRAIVFARELDSYHRIVGLCDARFAHDCAFFFDYSPYQAAGVGTLHAFRTDLESAGALPLPHDNDDISATAASLPDWLATISRHARVETDRAHVMIAAALMGKDVAFLPGVNPKVAALAQTLPAGARLSRIALPADPPPVPAPPEPPARARLTTTAGAVPPAPAIAAQHGDPRVCAVILSRNRPQLVTGSVRSVLRSGAGVRALVFDNNSDSRTRSVLRELADTEPGVTIRLSDRNLGCAGGRHLAVLDVAEELVLFLDDDAELLPGALERLVAELDQHPQVQAVTSLVVEPDGVVSHCGGSTVVDSDYARFTLDGNGLAFDDPAVPPTGRCDWVPGTAALVRRSALERCPIDPGMASYYEDNDWALRMSAAYPEPFRRCREALVIHHPGPRPAIDSELAARDFVSRRLATLAHFQSIHGRLLASGGTETAEVLAGAGPLAAEPAAARLLLRAVAASGPERFAVDWAAGDLATVLESLRTQNRAHDRVAQERARLAEQLEGTRRSHAADRARLDSLVRERDALAADHHALTVERDDLAMERDRALAEAAELERQVAVFRARHEMLARVEAGGWWRLRGRIHGVLGAVRSVPGSARVGRRER